MTSHRCGAPCMAGRGTLIQDINKTQKSADRTESRAFELIMRRRRYAEFLQKKKNAAQLSTNPRRTASELLLTCQRCARELPMRPTAPPPPPPESPPRALKIAVRFPSRGKPPAGVAGSGRWSMTKYARRRPLCIHSSLEPTPTGTGANCAHRPGPSRPGRSRTSGHAAAHR